MMPNYGAGFAPPTALINACDDPFSGAADRRAGFVWESPAGDNFAEAAMRSAYAPATPSESEPLKRPQHLMVGKRRRLNGVGMILSFLIPYALFFGVTTMLSFETHYRHAWECDLIVFATLCLVIATGLGAAGKIKNKMFESSINEPSWTIFLAITMAFAWVSAAGTGEYIFEFTTRPYWDLKSLNNFTRVNPQYIRGQMVMDAGFIKFVPGTKLDLTKSMGFRHENVYCVAPISFGSAQLNTYDFWAVGTNCCSGIAADFHCANFNNQHSNGAMRLVGGHSEQDRAYYRLAVQQAEAAYGIQATHPLFFNWVSDPEKEMDKYIDQGWKMYCNGLASFFFMQLFFVLVASLGFGKIGGR